jgi:apolipoprotein N-acyltransferase
MHASSAEVSAISVLRTFDCSGVAFRNLCRRARCAHDSRCPAGIPGGLYFTCSFPPGRLRPSHSCSFSFFVLGLASRKLMRTHRYSDAIWIANPVTVGLGFATYKSIYHALYPLGYLSEYASPLALLIFCLAAPAVFAGCFYVGTISFKRKPQNVVTVK